MKEIHLIKKKEKNVLVSEIEQYDGMISVTPSVLRVLDQKTVRALIVPQDADDIDDVRNDLTEEGWHFKDMDNGVLILRPKMKKSEREKIVNLVQRNELNKRGDRMMDVKKLVSELGDVKGVDFVAILDDMGEELGSAGNPGKGVKKGDLLTQTSMIQSISAKSGENLNKGAIKEIVVMWENGISVLKNLDKGYTLHVLTSKEALALVRLEIKERCE
jgi:hypothetical protein